MAQACSAVKVNIVNQLYHHMRHSHNNTGNSSLCNTPIPCSELRRGAILHD